MENKIQAKVGKKIKIPALKIDGVELHEVTIKFWPAHERRGRKTKQECNSEKSSNKKKEI
jgi:hypothetical protein